MPTELENLMSALGQQQGQVPATSAQPQAGLSGTALASLAGQLANAIAPNYWGGRIGAVAAQSAQSELLAQEQKRKQQALLQQLGLTPAGQAGPTTATINADGTIATKGDLVDAQQTAENQANAQGQPQPQLANNLSAQLAQPQQTGGAPLTQVPFLQALPEYVTRQR